MTHAEARTQKDYYYYLRCKDDDDDDDDDIHACVQRPLAMMCNRLPLTTFLFLSATVLLPQASAYKILMLPFLGKSHVFSMAAIAEGLASRGHRVTLFLGEHFRLNLPELKNRTEISVARYNDETNGKQFDYDALEDKCSNSSIETGGSVKDLLSIMSKA